MISVPILIIFGNRDITYIKSGVDYRAHLLTPRKRGTELQVFKMRKNILLVDDDEIFNFVNQKMLQHAGVASEIHIALSGQQGLELLNSYLAGNRALPDVIFLDLNMPVMDGFSFLEAFNRIKVPGNKRISIVVVTSSADPGDKERARAFGIKTFLTKPISKQDIINALSEN